MLELFREERDELFRQDFLKGINELVTEIFEYKTPLQDLNCC